MLQVIRKEEESPESLMRRFNKKIIQSGVLGEVRRKRYFEKPISKRDARTSAIRKRERKEAKLREAIGIR